MILIPVLGNEAEKATTLHESLLRAITEGTTDQLGSFLEGGADVNETDDKGQTPLHLAARQRHAATVRLLLSKGADVHLKDNLGWTALHSATAEGAEEVARLLIAAGANINARDAGGNTPLHLATDLGHKALVELLLAKGCPRHRTDG